MKSVSRGMTVPLVAVAAAAAVTGTAVMSQSPATGPPLAQEAVMDSPELKASTGAIGGVAIDPETIVSDIPVLGDLAWSAIKPQLGDTTAVAVLPGVSTAFAGQGHNAQAFSILGLAAASTDVDIKDPVFNATLFSLPTGQVACIGALTFANSSTAGTCVNVLGVFDATYDKKGKEVSLALTNPLGLLTDGDLAGSVIGGILSGDPISQIVTSDFARLGLGGKDMVSLTSSYGFDPISKALQGGVLVGWAGSTMLLFPVTSGDGGGFLGKNKQVNYLGLPQFNFGTPTSLNDLIPTLQVGQFRTPIPGVTIPGWSSEDLVPSGSNKQAPAGGQTVTVNAEAVAPKPIIPPVENESPAPVVDTPAAPVEPAAPAEPAPAPVENTPAEPVVEAPSAEPAAPVESSPPAAEEAPAAPAAEAPASAEPVSDVSAE